MPTQTDATAQTEKAANRLDRILTVSTIRKTFENCNRFLGQPRLNSGGMLVWAVNMDNYGTVIADCIGNLADNQYDEFARLLGQTLQIAKSSNFTEFPTEAPQWQQVATLVAGRYFFIIAGLDRKLGQGCLIAAAAKTGLLSEREAKQYGNNYYNFVSEMQN